MGRGIKERGERQHPFKQPYLIPGIIAQQLWQQLPANAQISASPNAPSYLPPSSPPSSPTSISPSLPPSHPHLLFFSDTDMHTGSRQLTPKRKWMKKGGGMKKWEAEIDKWLFLSALRCMIQQCPQGARTHAKQLNTIGTRQSRPRSHNSTTGSYKAPSVHNTLPWIKDVIILYEMTERISSTSNSYRIQLIHSNIFGMQSKQQSKQQNHQKYNK